MWKEWDVKQIIDLCLRQTDNLVTAGKGLEREARERDQVHDDDPSPGLWEFGRWFPTPRYELQEQEQWFEVNKNALPLAVIPWWKNPVEKPIKELNVGLELRKKYRKRDVTVVSTYIQESSVI